MGLTFSFAWCKKLPELRHLTCKDIWQGINDYWVNDGMKLALILLYCLGNVAVILEAFITFYVVDTNAYHVLKWGIIFARCSAEAIKLNSAIILVPVMRNLLSWLRGTWLGSYLPIDKAIMFHRKIAWILAFYTAVHITAHYFNFLRIWNYPGNPNDLDTYINIPLDANYDPPNAWQLSWTTVAGTTGHIAALCLVLMYTTAVDSVRRPMFELFWYTHHLFLLYFLLISVHGIQRLIGPPPIFWAWVLPGLALYTVERLIRIFRGSITTMLFKAVQHPSSVVELQMKKDNFRFKAGQYLFLNCPYIARQEWHPFTISSAPEEDFVSVHIRVAGDWTGKLQRLLNPEKKLGVICEDVITAPNGSPILRIDGPFGAASEDIFKFEIVVLIGAGIGVTPFASILKTIRFRIEAQQATGEIDIPITKVYFYWIAREKNSFEWFLELLCSLEDANEDGLLELHTYLTSLKGPDAESEALLEEDDEDMRDRDPITGLKTGSHYGRPDFKKIFQEKADAHPNSHIGVFFCGPPALSKQLYSCCRKFTKKTSTKFHYHKENF